MAETDDIHWLRENANELNNLLQVISESAHALGPLCQNLPETAKYLGFITESLERAKAVTGEMTAKVGGLSQVEPGAIAPVSSEPMAPNLQGDRELILLIDDEEMICVLAGEMLTGAGYRVATAVHPFRALEIFRQFKDEIALVILDFTLPILDGAEVFEELRLIRPNIAVMLSSGFAEQAKVREMLAKGLRGFLPKPYTEAKLLSQVRIVLDSIQAGRTGERRVM